MLFLSEEICAVIVGSLNLYIAAPRSTGNDPLIGPDEFRLGVDVTVAAFPPLSPRRVSLARELLGLVHHFRDWYSSVAMRSTNVSVSFDAEFSTRREIAGKHRTSVRPLNLHNSRDHQSPFCFNTPQSTVMHGK
jgi:hypothetical protein